MRKSLKYFWLMLTALLLSLSIGIYVSPSFRTKMINTWFDIGMYVPHSDEDLHKYSQWYYLTEAEFSEIVRDGVSKLNRPISENSQIFEIGMGVGAALKVIKDDYPNIDFGGSDFSENAIDFAKENRNRLEGRSTCRSRYMEEGRVSACCLHACIMKRMYW